MPGDPVAAGGFGGDVVVIAAEILDEGVTGGEDSYGAVPLQSAHRPEPGFEPSMVCFDRVVRVLLDGVQRRGDQLVKDPGIDGRAVGRDLGRDRTGAQCPGEETVAGSMAARPRSLNELRGEPLYPPVDGDVINRDAALGQQLPDVPLGQSVPQVPADRERDYLVREPEAGQD